MSHNSKIDLGIEQGQVLTLNGTTLTSFLYGEGRQGAFGSHVLRGNWKQNVTANTILRLRMERVPRPI